MNLNFLCCIGAEQKHDQSGLLKMNQVYFYRAYADETMSEILEDNFFNHSESHLKENDIILAYSPNEEDLPKVCWLRIVIPHAGLVKTEQVDNSYLLEVLRNDLGDLGDQVAGIEEKIPENASAQNQLATKNQITDLQNNKQDVGDYATNIALSQKQDIATAVNYNNIANCITEIPQDIKLELNNGTLTLKAGSKVYVPNGSGIFDTVTTSADIIANSPWGGGSDNIMLFTNGTSFTGIPVTRCYSGSSQPTVSGPDAYWYDTANNVIKQTTDTGTTWTATTLSLPIAIFSRVSGTITAIKQVFNGLGYIGAIIFATPGVKGLIPDGYNNDGTLKNATFTTSGVLVSGTITGTFSYSVRLASNQITVGVFPYDVATNKNYNSTIAPGNERGQANVGTMKIVANTIVSLRPKTVFHAVDYSDTEYIAHQAMPSDSYVDLTLGASGTAYTAPADGYIKITKNATTAGQYIDIYTTDMGVGTTVTATGAQALRCFCPVAKGDRVTVSYTAAGTTDTFRFVFANGAK